MLPYKELIVEYFAQFNIYLETFSGFSISTIGGMFSGYVLDSSIVGVDVLSCYDFIDLKTAMMMFIDLLKIIGVSIDAIETIIYSFSTFLNNYFVDSRYLLQGSQLSAFLATIFNGYVLRSLPLFSQESLCSAVVYIDNIAIYSRGNTLPSNVYKYLFDAFGNFSLSLHVTPNSYCQFKFLGGVIVYKKGMYVKWAFLYRNFDAFKFDCYFDGLIVKNTFAVIRYDCCCLYGHRGLWIFYLAPPSSAYVYL